VSALLEATRLTLRHRGADRDAVRDASLAVRSGEILVLAGPNGSGKSTLIAALGGQLAPRSGRIWFDGCDLSRLSRRALARRVASLPQSPALPEGVSVEALVAHGRHPHRGIFAPLKASDRAAVRGAISALELEPIRRRTLETLSGGERRRAWLAMVLAQQPELLLLDEPTAALDPRQQWEVIERLSGLNRECGLTLVVSLHDLDQAAGLAHRVALMHRGRVYAVGPPELTLREESLRDVFCVDARIEKADGVTHFHVRGPADPLRSL
jgi:iron complex transport system ATP-binding protein